MADWHDVGTPHTARYWAGREWHVGAPANTQKTGEAGSKISRCGVRHAVFDGSLRPEINVHPPHADDPIAAEQARQLARALIAAADEVDRLL